MRTTLETEAAFLLLRARRILKFSRDAEARGEPYQDLSHPADLKCGVAVKMVFENTPSGYQPIVQIYSSIPIEKATTIACELLGGAVKLQDKSSTGYTYSFERVL